MTYLHADHLGSTVLETNITGTVTTDEKYLAYGKQRDSGKVVTDHRFTGQKEDASGLQYFNARFYDPVIGMFVSPDTIVPQPGLASDYNRYLAFRGNPLRFVDPTGHCVAEGQDGYNSDENQQCWTAANQIYTLMQNDPERAKKVKWGDPEQFIKYVAPNAQVGLSSLQLMLDAFWYDFYTSTGIYNKKYNPTPEMHPVKREDQLFERMNMAIGDALCTTWDCEALILDILSLVLSVGGDAAIGCAVASAGSAADVCVPASVATKAVDISVTGYSVNRTWRMYAQGNASVVDAVVSSSTGSISFVPGAGEAAGVFQLTYDMADPMLSVVIPNNKPK